METSIVSLRALFRLNTRMYLNCLEGLSDSEAQARPSSETNSIAFLALHLADTRYFLAGYLGLSVQNPLADYEAASGIDDIEEMPSVEELRTIWRDVASHLEECFDSLTPDQLSATSEQSFPVEDPTVLGGIAFLAQHEAYHIGQMGLVRKYLGKGGIGYH